MYFVPIMKNGIIIGLNRVIWMELIKSYPLHNPKATKRLSTDHLGKEKYVTCVILTQFLKKYICHSVHVSVSKLSPSSLMQLFLLILTHNDVISHQSTAVILRNIKDRNTVSQTSRICYALCLQLRSEKC